MCIDECGDHCCLLFFLGAFFMIPGIGVLMIALTTFDEIRYPEDSTRRIICLLMSSILLIVGSCSCCLALKHLCIRKYPVMYNSSTNINRIVEDSTNESRIFDCNSIQQNSVTENDSKQPSYPGHSQIRKEDPLPSYSEAISMPRLKY